MNKENNSLLYNIIRIFAAVAIVSLVLLVNFQSIRKQDRSFQLPNNEQIVRTLNEIVTEVESKDKDLKQLPLITEKLKILRQFFKEPGTIDSMRYVFGSKFLSSIFKVSNYGEIAFQSRFSRDNSFALLLQVKTLLFNFLEWKILSKYEVARAESLKEALKKDLLVIKQAPSFRTLDLNCLVTLSYIEKYL